MSEDHDARMPLEETFDEVDALRQWHEFEPDRVYLTHFTVDGERYAAYECPCKVAVSQKGVVHVYSDLFEGLNDPMLFAVVCEAVVNRGWSYTVTKWPEQEGIQAAVVGPDDKGVLTYDEAPGAGLLISYLGMLTFERDGELPDSMAGAKKHGTAKA